MLRKNKFLLILLGVFTIYFLGISAVLGNVTIIKPVEAADGTLFLIYSENQDKLASNQLFVPSTIGEFPKGILWNLSLIIIPANTPHKISLLLEIGRLNTTTNQLIPQNMKWYNFTVTERTKSIVLDLPVARDYVFARLSYHELSFTFSYVSPEEKIIEKRSLASLNSLIINTIITAAVFAIIGVVLGGIFVRRVAKIILPMWVYFTIFGAFVAALTFYVAFSLSVALYFIYGLVFIIGFIIGAHTFRPHLQKLYANIVTFNQDKINIQPQTIFRDNEDAIVHETFSDMILRIFGYKTNFHIPALEAWHFGDEKNPLYFFKKLEIQSPSFKPKETREWSFYAVLVSSVLLSISSYPNYLVMATFIVLGLIGISILSWFNIVPINTGHVTYELMTRHEAEEFAKAMKALNYTLIIAEKYVDLQYDLYDERLNTETKSYEKAKILNQKLLDAIGYILGISKNKVEKKEKKREEIENGHGNTQPINSGVESKGTNNPSIGPEQKTSGNSQPEMAAKIDRG